MRACPLGPHGCGHLTREAEAMRILRPNQEHVGSVFSKGGDCEWLYSDAVWGYNPALVRETNT